MAEFTPPRFPRGKADGFSMEIRKRIQSYFKDNEIANTGDWRIYHKAILWIGLYIGPFVVLLTGIIGDGLSFAFWFLMGIAMFGIGLNVMHDGNHGSYAKKGWMNKLAGASLIIMGGSPFNWRLQHNVLHHTYTNIHEHDEDLAPGVFMKFTPADKTRWIHRYQHIYAPFFYCLMTLYWVTHKDFGQVTRYHKKGLIEANNSTFAKELWKTIAIKIGYFSVIIGLPLLLTDLSWWSCVLGFIVMHAVAGLLMALVFQSAHVIQETDHPVPVSGSVEDEWMIHQLRTTANFATKNKLVGWFVGGLNFQVEHHLFPNISHVHYPKIAGIVKQCAKDFGLPYHEAPTFRRAIRSHFRLMKELGRAPSVA